MKHVYHQANSSSAGILQYIKNNRYTEIERVTIKINKINKQQEKMK